MYFYYEKRRGGSRECCYRAGEDINKAGENLYNDLPEYSCTSVGRIDKDSVLGYPDVDSFGHSINPENMLLLRLYDILCDYEGMACEYPLWYVISEDGLDVEVVDAKDKINYFGLYLEEVAGWDFAIPPSLFSDDEITPEEAEAQHMYALADELRKYKEEQGLVE